MLNNMTSSSWLNCLLIYLFAMLVSYIHELGHYYFVKKAGLECEELELGLLPVLRIKNVKFGIFFGGKTKFNSDGLLRKEDANMKLLGICLGGIISQSLLELILLPFMANSLVTGLLITNGLLLLVNLIPVKDTRVGASDGAKAILILKAMSKRENVLEM